MDFGDVYEPSSCAEDSTNLGALLIVIFSKVFWPSVSLLMEGRYRLHPWS